MKGGSVLRNSVTLITGNVVAKLINLVLVLILARMFGAAGFGLYSFAFAFVMMFMLLTQFGMNTFLVRHIATDRNRVETALPTALSMVLVLSLLTLPLVNGVAWVAGWSAAERVVILLFSIYMVFDSWSRFLFSVFRAYERMEFEALVFILERCGLLVAALIVWAAGAGLPELVAAFAGVELLKASLAFILVRRHFTPLRPAWQSGLAFSLLRQSMPFALMILFATLTLRIDIIMLKLFHSVEMAGLYGVGRRLIESLAFLPESVVSALFPALSLLFLRSRARFDITFQRALRYFLLIALPLAALLFTYAESIVGLLFAPEFAAAAVALRWMAIWLGLLFVKHLFAVTLNAVGRQRSFSLIAGLTMVINVLLNLLLIPAYDLMGAGVATVSAELLTTVIAFFVLRRELGLPKLEPRLLATLGAGLLLILSLALMRDWPLPAGSLLGLAVYLLALPLLRAVAPEDLGLFIRQFLGARPSRGEEPAKDEAALIQINARFLTQPISGVQRYGHELIQALDDLIEERHEAVAGLRFELLAPAQGRIHEPALMHIPLRSFGRRSGHVWEQFELPRRAGGALLFCPGNTAPLASLGGSAPVVVTVHDLSYLYFPDAYSAAFKAAYRLLIPAIFQEADRVITVSNSERDAIRARYPAVNERLKPIQNGGLAARHLAAVSGPAPADRDDPPLLLYVGALNRRKNIQGILKAFELLSTSREARLVIVGGGGRSFDNNAFAIDERFRSRVEFLGQVDDTERLLELYRRATCLLFPSFYEASPLPPLEAMACGCPVLASSIPSLIERCGEDALFCDPHDAADIAAKIETLLASPELSSDLSRCGRERAAHYTWRQCALATVAVMREALEGVEHEPAR